MCARCEIAKPVQASTGQRGPAQLRAPLAPGEPARPRGRAALAVSAKSRGAAGSAPARGPPSQATLHQQRGHLRRRRRGVERRHYRRPRPPRPAQELKACRALPAQCRHSSPHPNAERLHERDGSSRPLELRFVDCLEQALARLRHRARACTLGPLHRTASGRE